jgi:hypothetical protein
MRKRLMICALALLLLLTCACSGNRQERKVVGSCAGYDVLYEELRYVTLTYKEMFRATYGENIWDDPATAEQYRAELEETVHRVMLNNYAVLAACAAHAITAEDLESDAIQSAVDAKIEEAIEGYGGEKEFEKALQDMYMTEHFLRFCLTVAQLENELKYALIDINRIENDVDRFMKWIEDGNGVYVQHIFVRNDAGEDPEQNRALAEDVRVQILGGTDISKFVGSSVNDDLQNVAPYYIVRDVYVEALESAALSLGNVGEVSQVVEVEDGYYVLVRMEESFGENGEKLSLMPKVTSLLTSYQWAKVEAYVDTYRADLKIEWNEYGKSIDLLAIQ